MPSIDDLEPGDIVEYTDGKFGVGRLSRIIYRRKGDKHTDIELKLSMGRKTIIREENIRWDKTMSHKNKQQPGQMTLNNVE